MFINLFIWLFCTSTVDEKFVTEPVGAHTFENNVVGLEGFEVNARRQCWVHALCQPLGYFDPPWYHRKFHIIQQNFVQLAKSGYQIGPFARVFKIFQGFIHRLHIAAIQNNKIRKNVLK